MGKDKTHDGRVRLKKLRAVNWENIDWSELWDTISKDPGIGSLGFFRGITEEVANSFGSGSQRKIGFSSEHRGQPKDSGNKDKKERGTVGLAGSKNALNAERGETTLDAPEGGEKEGRKMTVRGQAVSGSEFWSEEKKGSSSEALSSHSRGQS